MKDIIGVPAAHASVAQQLEKVNGRLEDLADERAELLAQRKMLEKALANLALTNGKR